MVTAPRAHLVGIAGRHERAGRRPPSGRLDRQRLGSEPRGGAFPPGAGGGRGDGIATRWTIRPPTPTHCNGWEWPGHSACHVTPDIDLLIYSLAVGPENVELRRAGELGIPTLSYAQMLGRLMAGKQGLAVAGTHGKSTTTAMAAAVLVAAGLRSHGHLRRHAAGGPLGRTSRPRRPWCWSRPANIAAISSTCGRSRPPSWASSPTISIATTRSADLEAALSPSLPRWCRADGLLLVRHDCPATRRVAAAASCRMETFGMPAEADWSARNLATRAGRYRFEIQSLRSAVGAGRLADAGPA